MVAMTAEAQLSSRAGAFDETGFRRILGQFATGVTIVTIVDPEGGLSGFTASAFSSVSLDPPLVLVCVKYGARSYRHLRQQQAFTIHILAADQTRIAHSFAAPGGDRSMACDWRVNQRAFSDSFGVPRGAGMPSVPGIRGWRPCDHRRQGGVHPRPARRPRPAGILQGSAIPPGPDWRRAAGVVWKRR